MVNPSQYSTFTLLTPVANKIKEGEAEKGRLQERIKKVRYKTIQQGIDNY